MRMSWSYLEGHYVDHRNKDRLDNRVEVLNRRYKLSVHLQRIQPKPKGDTREMSAQSIAIGVNVDRVTKISIVNSGNPDTTGHISTPYPDAA
ncbi:predicted protein [Lichtheimia corymbifera JMRC:FSU:9682]|uniref:Uncharacterized protein n=1 Tax=Lichtheimia corymbifera JMRC:FSU:9682 TaxID=1263082 RepID=A0A068RNN9_9FUNG|nr:predicted protein [Lichtheimia corymbifera JMRC:FSU:9682]